MKLLRRTMPRKPGPKKQKKLESATEAAQILEDLAGQLRAHADFTDLLAESIVKMRASGLVILTGNFHFALEKIRGFFSSQVIQKLIGAEYGDARVDYEVLSKLMAALGELESNAESSVSK